VSFTFGSEFLEPGERIVVVSDRTAFTARYGDQIRMAQGDSTVFDDWVFKGNLGNDGDRITLLDARGSTIHRFDYRDRGSWPIRAAGLGGSLEIVDPRGNYSDPRNWRNSNSYGGSPGTRDASLASRVAINELAMDARTNTWRAIELHNVTEHPIDISNWYLSDTLQVPYKFPIPSTPPIAARGYHVLDISAWGIPLDQNFGNHLYLSETEQGGRPKSFADILPVSTRERFRTVGRWPDDNGELFPLKRETLGGPNSGPYVSDVVISEVLYFTDEPQESFEFVELHNRGNGNADVSGWRLSGSIQFVFPSNTTLRAGETLAVVGFDPNDQRAGRVFALIFGLTENVRMVGPFIGRLDDTRGLVELERMDIVAAEPALSVHSPADRVPYDSITPWPANLTKTRQSLTRAGLGGFGHDATNWKGESTSPGKVRGADLNGDRVITPEDIDLACAAILRSNSNLQFDMNRDEKVDRADFNFLIRSILGTTIGDSNLDGVFDSRDVVLIFQFGQFEDALPANSTWATGDWNCDGEFSTADLVIAFQVGGFI
jgi:hypothetical protein